MRLHLVALAVLLPALCSADHYKAETLDQLAAFKDNKQDAAVKQALGNGIVSALIAASGTLDDKSIDVLLADEHMKGALYNGLACFLEKNDAAAVKKLLYGDDAGYNAGRAAEIAAAKAKGIECGATPTGPAEMVDCFCTKNNVLLYCAAEEFKKAKTVPAHPTKCPEEAFTALKGLSAELANTYAIKSLNDLKKDAVEGVIEALKLGSVESIKKALQDDVSKILCHSLDDKVAGAVSELMSSDIIYYLGEISIMIKVMGAASLEAEDKCNNDNEFKTSVFGECLCSSKYGFDFCLDKHFAAGLKKDGAIDCTKYTIDDSKAPKTLPVIGNASTSGNATTAAPAGSSSSLSLLVLSLSAVAAMLARAH